MANARNEAAAAVNDAFRAAKITSAVDDPNRKHFSYEVAGHTGSYTFKSHRKEARKEEVAHLRLALVNELLAKVPAHLSPKSEPPAATEPAKSEPAKS